MGGSGARASRVPLAAALGAHAASSSRGSTVHCSGSAATRSWPAWSGNAAGAGPNAFRVYGAVTFHVPDFSIADGGGWWCLPGGPRTDYEWSVTGNTLTLAPAGGKDACGIRGFIWTGEWMRAGRA